MEKRAKKGPAIRLHLARHFDMSNLENIFRPMGLPNRIEVKLDDALPRILEDLEVHMELGLAPGLYELPLTFGQPCVLEVGEGCAANGRVSIGLPASRPEVGPVIREVVVAIDPPLVFRNIAHTLLEVNKIFKDKTLQTLRQCLDASVKRTPLRDGALVRQLLDLGLTAAGSSLPEYVDRHTDIALRHIIGRPEFVDGAWRLELFFSGTIQCLEMLPIPFYRIRLPAFILPPLHASIEKLASGSPLASAELLADNIPVRDLARALIELPEHFSMCFRNSGRLSLLKVRLETILGSLIQGEVVGPEAFGLTGDISGQMTDGRLHVLSEGIRLSLGDNGVSVRLSGDLAPAELLELLLKKLAPEESGDRSRPAAVQNVARLSVTVLEGSSLGRLRGLFGISHPLVEGQGTLPLRVTRVAVSGDGALVVDRDGKVAPEKGGLDFLMDLEVPPGAQEDASTDLWQPSVKEGHLKGHVSWDDGVAPTLTLEGEAGFAIHGTSRVEAIPELSIDDGALSACVEGTLSLAGQARVITTPEGFDAIDIRGTSAHVTLAKTRVSLDGRTLRLPEKTRVACNVGRGELATSGLGELAMDVKYDLCGESPVLSGARGDVELFVNDLRQGEMTVKLSPAGGLSIEGEDRGLYDAHFFNALINPQTELKRLLEIVENDEAVGRVLATLEVFSPELAEWLELGHKKLKEAREMAREEGITEPKHVIPRNDMARIFSRLFCGTEALTERLIPIIKRVTDGHGLDRLEVKKIINELHPDHLYDFELDRVLRWFDHLLSPWDPIPAPAPQAAPPLVEDPQFAAALRHLPSAAEIYAVGGGIRPMPEGFSGLVARFAPYYTLEQVDYILARVSHRDSGPTSAGKTEVAPEARRGGSEAQDSASEEQATTWEMRHLARLAYIREIKRRTRMISEQYGGVEFIPQAMAIAFFLGEVFGPGARARIQAGFGHSSDETLDPLCPWDLVAGPEDVAVLLQAGLALPLENAIVQINQRLLLDYIADQPRSFLLEVLVEMGRNSPRVLAGLLMALLEQDQSRMKEPLDLPAFFSKRLGIPVPRRVDYMAGGRCARVSYFDAIFGVAEFIIRSANPYLARKDRLQVHRHVPAAAPRVGVQAARLADRARAAIAGADSIGARCTFTENVRGPRARAITAYQRAFAACAKLLEADRSLFQMPWLKAFWARNYEALVVLSVVRNYQQDIDRVRNWLHVRTGKSAQAAKKIFLNDEQALLEAVIDALYYFEEDRKALKADPLVRLLIDPPPGRYNFTIVSCMGIITEGAKGTELEATFRRLEKARGIKTIRADTPTMRSLEFNAKRVEAAIREARTPWGYVGYSQGCANGLKTESLLRGGTPEQQRLLEGLRCRNLLFGAHNGSAHGTCSNEKLRRALVEGEHFFKHYQALFSSWAIDSFLKGIRMTLDSSFFVHVLGGAESVSHEVCVALARDGQYLGHVPTSTVRGVLSEEIMPEALEFLSHVLSHQVSGAPHDTQVTLPSSVGYPNLVENDVTRMMERCDMGSMPQSTHHWSPLLQETAFITTQRDLERAIYDFPKDRHIFPWIEVNARFGVIETIG